MYMKPEFISVTVIAPLAPTTSILLSSFKSTEIPKFEFVGPFIVLERENVDPDFTNILTLPLSPLLKGEPTAIIVPSEFIATSVPKPSPVVEPENPTILFQLSLPFKVFSVLAKTLINPGPAPAPCGAPTTIVSPSVLKSIEVPK